MDSMDYYWWLKFLRRYPTLLLTPIPQPHQLIHVAPRKPIGAVNSLGKDEGGQDVLQQNLYLQPPIPPPQTLEDRLRFLEGYKKLLEEDLAEIQRELAYIEEQIKELKSLIKKQKHVKH